MGYFTCSVFLQNQELFLELSTVSRVKSRRRRRTAGCAHLERGSLVGHVGTPSCVHSSYFLVQSEAAVKLM